MPSHAQHVFAIPELLESILLSIEAPLPYLFRLQRVHSNFQETLRHSPKLRRRMHLSWPQPQPTIDPNPETPTQLKHISFNPLLFTLDFTHFAFWTYLGPNLVFKHSPSTNAPQAAIQPTTSPRLTSRPPQIALKHPGSWRQTLLVRRATAFNVCVLVASPHTLYAEILHVGHAQPFTLGELAEKLGAVLARTSEEHGAAAERCSAENAELAGELMRLEDWIL